jgi:NAD(P)-dependent dehydrogenase (short-subunit alcohol dehydrogenase family)
MGRLDGKVVFITGAGSGIGRAGALAFAKEGAQVAVADISSEGGQASVELVRQAGGQASYIETNVTDPASVKRAIGTAVSTYGRLNVLYNNAGGSTANDGPVDSVSLDEWWRTINVDLFGTFLCCKYGIPELIKAGGGSVINTTSYVALSGIPGRDAYTAAKGGVLALTRSMAVEYAKHNIRVNAIAPGAIQTDRVKKFLAEDPRVQSLVDKHLLGLGVPEDIANMALFLASDESRISTGVVFPVDSGLAAS